MDVGWSVEEWLKTSAQLWDGFLNLRTLLRLPNVDTQSLCGLWLVVVTEVH